MNLHEQANALSAITGIPRQAFSKVAERGMNRWRMIDESKATFYAAKRMVAFAQESHTFWTVDIDVAIEYGLLQPTEALSEAVTVATTIQDFQAFPSTRPLKGFTGDVRQVAMSANDMYDDSLLAWKEYLAQFMSRGIADNEDYPSLFGWLITFSGPDEPETSGMVPMRLSGMLGMPKYNFEELLGWMCKYNDLHVANAVVDFGDAVKDIDLRKITRGGWLYPTMRGVSYASALLLTRLAMVMDDVYNSPQGQSLGLLGSGKTLAVYEIVQMLRDFVGLDVELLMPERYKNWLREPMGTFKTQGDILSDLEGNPTIRV